MDPRQPSTSSSTLDETTGLSKETVRAQLARVLVSPQFAGRPVLRKFLSYIVEKTLAGQAHEIKEYTVATEVFGRGERFTGINDSVVRIQAGRLRRALERHYASHGAKDPVMIEIQKGSYVPAFYKVPAAPGSETIQPGQESLALSAICEPSVAVMPLANLTGDPSQEYFTDGLTEELTQELARFQGLRVVASHSTVQLKGEKIGAREMGHRLGARFLIEGGLRKDEQNLKISVRLIDTLTGMQIWGDQYRREFKPESLIALQEDIAGRVVGRIGDLFGVLSAQLSGESRKKSPKKWTTHEAFLRFYHYHNSFSAESFSAAFKALENAVAEEPESGLAWSLLANLHAHKYCLGDSQTNETIETAMSMALTGVFLEPRNQMAHNMLAFVLFLKNDKDGFFREAEETVALNPYNPAIIAFIGWARAMYGDWEDGLALLANGSQLNPHFPGWYRMVPCIDYYRRECFPEALREARQINMPQFFWDHLLKAAVLGRMGSKREAYMEAERLLALRPDFPSCGPHLIRMFVKAPSLVEAILDGLRKAGLKI